MNNFFGGLLPIGSKIWGVLLLSWNFFVFLIYGWDKLAAKKHWRRIPENVLLSLAFLMGAIGAMLGMIIWHHKTAKPKFRILVPLFLLANIGLLWVMR